MKCKQPNKRKWYFSFLIFMLLTQKVIGQKDIIGFYNCENFYDTTNQVNVSDEDFLPSSTKGYSQKIFNSKSIRLAHVLYALGNLENTNGLSLLGVVEIENKMVLTKLLSDPLIRKHHYKFIHFDSKDARGVDVALIYHPEKFTPYQYRPYSLSDDTHFNTYSTRDILFVKGSLGNEWVYILVNHWPSRRGGEQSSRPKRLWAAEVCKRIMDSINLENPNAKWIVMGDFNDNPSDKSLQTLKLYNPFAQLFKKGIGTLAYNDSWSLFDQILLSQNWLGITKSNTAARDKFNTINCKPVVYKNEEMMETQGRYQGYPKRTYNGNEFRGGYSDHFPVALIFSLKNDKNDLK